MRLRSCFWAVVFVCLGLTGRSVAVDSDLNVQEMAYIPQSEIGGLKDVWGWYDTQNSKYYALACNAASQTGGMVIIDVTDPQSPIFVGTAYHGEFRNAVDVKVVGDYAYVASQVTDLNISEIWIYYLPTVVADPSQGLVNVLELIDDGSGDVPLDNCHTLFATDEYLFLLESHISAYPDPFELAVLSLADRANPALLSEGIWDVSDFDPAFTWPHAAYVRGTTAYIFNFIGGVYEVEFNGGTGGIISWKKIWYNTERGDIQNLEPHGYYTCDPSHPKLPWTHSGWLTEDGQYILVADEHPGDIGACQDNMTPCLRIFDVDDFYVPQDPDIAVVPPANAFDILWNSVSQSDQYFIGAENIDTQGANTPCPMAPMGDCLFPDATPNYFTMGIHNPAVRGRLAFMAWYARGLQVVDLRDIDNFDHDIYHAGYFDHGTGIDGDWYAEAYGVYPFSPDGYIYVSGGQGLYIYRYGYTGLLEEDATWSGDIYLYDTFTVATSKRLEIAPGTNVYMFEDALLQIDGTLIANGTSSDSIRFIALGGNPQPGDWQGIYLNTNAACTLSYCSITKAVTGIEMADGTDAKVTNSNISDNDKDGFYVDGGKLYLGSSTLKYNNIGVYLREDSDGIIKDCNFIKNAGAGVLDYKGKLHMTDCTLEDNLLYGLNAYESIDSVFSTTFVNGNYGIKCYGDSDGLYEDCSITHPSALGTSYYGIYASKSLSANPRVLIRSDSINGYDQGGIYFNGLSSTSVITDTKVVSSGTNGVYYRDTAGDIHGGTGTFNLFKGHTNGLYITGSSSSPNVRRTKFWDNSSEGAYVALDSWADFGTSPIPAKTLLKL